MHILSNGLLNFVVAFVNETQKQRERERESDEEKKAKWRIVKVKRTLHKISHIEESEKNMAFFAVSLLPNHFGQIYLLIKIGVAACNVCDFVLLFVFYLIRLL